MNTHQISRLQGITMLERMENKKSVDELIDTLMQVFNKEGDIQLGQQGAGASTSTSHSDKGKGKQKI